MIRQVPGTEHVVYSAPFALALAANGGIRMAVARHRVDTFMLARLGEEPLTYGAIFDAVQGAKLGPCEWLWYECREELDRLAAHGFVKRGDERWEITTAKRRALS